MSAPTSKVTAQGQISVPAEVRRKLDIGPGSVLEWNADGEQVVVRKVGRYSSRAIHQAVFAGLLKRRSLAELREGVALYVKDKHARR